MGDYTDLKKADLIDLADEREIDSSGTKADIIARLEAADADVIAEGDDLPSLDDADESSADPEPLAPAQPEPEVVAGDDDPKPVARESGPWDALGKDIYSTLKEQAADLWQDGKEDRKWLLSVAQRIAKQKYLAGRADTNAQRRVHETNLRHLDAQFHGEVARMKMNFVKDGDGVFMVVLRTIVKTLAGSLVAAVL